MYRQRKKPINQASKQDTSWIPRGVEACREIAEFSIITTENFSEIFCPNDGVRLSADSAEQHLRKLTNMGWLHMAAVRDEQNKFVRFEWEMLR